MKERGWLWVLGALNLALVVHAFARPATGDAPEGILRGKGLEVVDEQGRVRFQVKVEPADPSYRWPGGTRVGYPETVILRLSTADGKPRVKLTTSTDGSGLMLLGSTDETHTTLHAEGAATSILLRDSATKQKVLAP
jgi:hypothetical protein